MKLGFGTWGLGGKDYGPLSQESAINLLIKSFQKGVSFFDTAPLYGEGTSERYLSVLIQKVGRKNVEICTKGGMLPHVGFDLKQDFSLDNLHKDIMGSLNRLETDYIDYYLIHSPSVKEVNFPEIINFFKEQRNKKIIRNFGVSLRSPSDYFEIENFELDIVEFNFNLLDQRATDIGLFEKLKLKKIKSICRTPLCFGFLCSAGILKKNLDKNDHRKLYWSDEQFYLWNNAKNYFLDFANELNYLDFSQFALHFCLSHKFDFVIPGIMNERDLDLNVSALKFLKMKKFKLLKIFSTYKKFEKKIYNTKK